MRILFVEDEIDAGAVIEAVLHGTNAKLELRRASSLTSAKAALVDFAPDVLICDLKIPTTDGAGNGAEAHGLAVQAFCREVRPGTITLFLTGLGTLDNLGEALAQSGTCRPFGTEEVELARWVHKDRVENWRAFVKWLNERFQALEDEVTVLTDEALPVAADRALRIFAKRVQAVDVTCTSAGGKSGATTLRATFLGDDGLLRAHAFVKVAKARKIRAECDRYNGLVVTRLLNGTFAAQAWVQDCNLRGEIAIFSSLLHENARSLFKTLTGTPSDAALVAGVRSAVAPWRTSAIRQSMTIGDLRRARINDEELTAGLAATESLTAGDQAMLAHLDELTVELLTACQHGDLHGENALVAGGSTTLIDFGDVGVAPVALDPLTLEMSLLFHTDSPNVAPWPTLEQAGHWWNLDALLVGCPYPDFVGACRAWARDGADEVDVLAMAYVHALRQLKYPDVPKDLALSVARGLGEELQRLILS